jgi:hypothetical protein
MLFAISANSRASAKRRTRTYDAYDSSDDGPSCWVNLIMFVSAVGCIVTSFNLLSDGFFLHTREEKVQQFSNTISNWTLHRNDLLRSNFSVGVEIKNKLRDTSVKLQKDTTQEIADILEQEKGDDLPTYDPLRFEVDRSPHGLLPTLNYTMPPEEEAVFVITASYDPPGDNTEPVISVLKVSAVFIGAYDIYICIPKLSVMLLDLFYFIYFYGNDHTVFILLQ